MGLFLKMENPKFNLVESAIRSNGCQISQIECKPCDRDANGFHRKSGPKRSKIVVCTNNITENAIPQTFFHEMIHAYDHCVGKLNTPEQTACSEIRAYYHSRCILLGLNEKKTRECVKSGAMSSLNSRYSKTHSVQDLESLVDTQMTSCINKPLVE